MRWLWVFAYFNVSISRPKKIQFQFQVFSDGVVVLTSQRGVLQFYPKIIKPCESFFRYKTSSPWPHFKTLRILQKRADFLQPLRSLCFCVFPRKTKATLWNAYKEWCRSCFAQRLRPQFSTLLVAHTLLCSINSKPTNFLSLYIQIMWKIFTS